MKLAIIDLDKVICNGDARFAKAEEAKQAFVNDLLAHFGKVDSASEKDATNLYWHTVFTPELVELDTLIDGVHEALDQLQRDGYGVMLLTSRPESMREATEQWLAGKALVNRYLNPFPLIMKAPAFQYVKTTVWKAGMVQTLEALYNVTDLLIVDDEQANINEHLKYFSNVQTRELCKSLAEAVAKLNGTWEEPDPFLPPE